MQNKQKDGAVAQWPSRGLDPVLAGALRSRLPALADEIIAAIGQAIPEYRRPMKGEFGRGVRSGVQRALEQFIALVADGGSSASLDREIYRQLGRGELRSGRGLDALQAAYRLGARMSWRRVSEVARDQGADAATVSLLAESVFAYIEEISASSVEGYAQAQAQLAGERERRRGALVRALVAPTGELDEQTLRARARDAGWEPPERLAAIVCEMPDPVRLSTLLGAEAIGARVQELACVLVSDPDAPGRHEEWRRVLQARGLLAVLGPTVPIGETDHSFRRARMGLELERRGVLNGAGLVLCSEHLLELLLLGEAQIASELAQRNLEPLDGESESSRARLRQTLLAWLRHQGSVPAVAAELGVHRQTVRYRLGRLRELFGEALNDPEARLEIELALRGLNMTGAPRRGR